MNRLWIRLSVTFGLLVLIGPLLLGLTGFFISQTGMLRLLIRSELTRTGGLIDQLESYYDVNGSWQGINLTLSVYDEALPRGPNLERIGLVLKDLNDQILYSSKTFSGDIRQNDDVDTLSINVQGRTRGYLYLVSRAVGDLPAMMQPEMQAFITRLLSQLLLALGVLSGILGVALGVIMSRTLTAPLAQLTRTAQSFGKHDFSQRAQIKGSREMRDLAQSFNEMADNLQTAEALRRNLVADVAHELRTPLAILQANLQAMQDGIYPLELTEIVKLASQTELLTRLVNELHELAQAEAKQLSLQLQRVDIASLTQMTQSKFKAIAQKHHIQMDVSGPSPIWVILDAYRMEQVLNNLFQNAVSHTPDGGRIDTTLAIYGEQVQITIQDSGVGISGEHLPHIFDRFYRVDRSRSRGSGGAGLGLTIAKAMVELQGGQITAQSDGIPGSGTRFTITLPT